MAIGFDRAMVERVDRMVAGAEFKRQVPPIAKLGPRTAGVDYLYPRRRPGSDARADGGRPGGTLYVVATPIGNLGDVTLRALEVLRAVPLIAAEDTRITRRLLDRYEIATRTTSATTRRAAPAASAELLAHLARGRGPRARDRCRHAGRLGPGRGARRGLGGRGRGGRAGARAPRRCSPRSRRRGVAGPRWAFEGFLPRSGRERRERLAAIAADERGTVLFEAPNRLAATLRDLAAACGADRPGAVCRELTKLHEQIVARVARRARGDRRPTARSPRGARS